MLTPEEVKQMIAAVVPCEHIEVEDRKSVV